MYPMKVYGYYFSIEIENSYCIYFWFNLKNPFFMHRIHLTLNILLIVKKNVNNISMIILYKIF